MRRFLLGFVLSLLLPASATATTLYTDPDGGGPACSQAAPCDLPTAFDAAMDHDTISIGPGTYGTELAPISVADVLTAVTVAGAVTGPGRPVLYLSNGMSLFNAGASVRDVEIRSGGTGLNLTAGATANRVIVRKFDTSDADACTPHGSTITNSVCSTPRTTSDSALLTKNSGGSTVRGATVVGAAYGFNVNNPGATTTAM
jgi:hypothetical protein